MGFFMGFYQAQFYRNFICIYAFVIALGYIYLLRLCQNGVFEGGGSIWPKISSRRGRSPPIILRVGKLDVSICVCIRIWVEILFVLSKSRV